MLSAHKQAGNMHEAYQLAMPWVVGHLMPMTFMSAACSLLSNTPAMFSTLLLDDVQEAHPARRWGASLQTFHSSVPVDIQCQHNRPA